jgi:D-arabinose 1-dehydrogenase-like Zn-dependent alcohol dehydrogenase
MALMRALQIEKSGSDFRLVQVEIPEPRENEVPVKVEVCGVCCGDAIVKEGIFPGSIAEVFERALRSQTPSVRSRSREILFRRYPR